MISPSTREELEKPVRVLVVDDHPLFRQGLVRILAADPRVEVVGQAGNGLEAQEKVRQCHPQVVVMDINMPECGGLEATLRLQTEAPQVAVLMLSISEEEVDLFTAVRFGARGYLLKSAEPGDLLQAVRAVARGDAYFSPAMAAKFLPELRRLDATPVAAASSLSEREREVLEILAQGGSNQDISRALLITENTVRTHLKHILEKLHLRNRSQAAAYAARLGLALGRPQLLPSDEGLAQ